jgi:hypothetical protein
MYACPIVYHVHIRQAHEVPFLSTSIYMHSDLAAKCDCNYGEYWDFFLMEKHREV